MNINDIAAQAGVSISTVSRVINNPERVSSATRQRVEAVLKKYSFSPNSIARAIDLNSRKIIAIFSNNICHQHFAATAYVLDDMFLNLGYSAILCSTGNDMEKKKKHFRVIAEQRVDGIALLGSTFVSPEIEDALRSYFPDIPMVISNGILSIENARSVLIDHYSGIKASISHLINKGHKQIGLVHSEITFNAKRKMDAFFEIMAGQSLKVPENHIFSAPISIEGGIEVANQYLSQKCDCTALLFFDDIVAVSAMNQLRRLGIAVPKDLAIIGYDNSQFSACSYPTLTTVDTKSEMLAVVLGNTLHDLMSNRYVGNTIVLSPELVIREST